MEYDIGGSGMCILRPWSLVFNSSIYYLVLSVRKELCVSERLHETAFRVSIIVIQVKLWLAALHIIVGPKPADGLWKRPQRSRLAHQDE